MEKWIKWAGIGVWVVAVALVGIIIGFGIAPKQVYRAPADTRDAPAAAEAAAVETVVPAETEASGPPETTADVPDSVIVRSIANTIQGGVVRGSGTEAGNAEADVTAGDGTAGDGLAGDETTGDETVGDGTAGDETSGGGAAADPGESAPDNSARNIVGGV
ncbi:MAG: hypothetical protein LBQ16_06890 [Gracilibacteraceae bacterium]|nr:hypothetical protein [Gracilibacteraceae bacterium]